MHKKSCYHILSIDPGLNHLGLSVTIVDFADKTVVKTVTDTVHVKDKNLNHYVVDNYGARQAKIDYLNEHLIKWIDQYQPITIAIETPFYNMRRPAAFMPLVELLYQLRLTVRTHAPTCNLALYPPSIIKKAVGAKGGAKKEEVKEQVVALESFFHLEDSLPIEELDEHSIDSLAIFYTHFHLSINAD